MAWYRPGSARLLSLCVLILLLPWAPLAQELGTIEGLYAHIKAQGGAATIDGVPIASDRADPQRTVGFLSAANWHSAMHTLPPNTQKYISSAGTSELVAMVDRGTIIGAVINGVPSDPSGVLQTFTSETVTPKAILFKPGTTSRSMREAIDASLVRLLARGKAQDARQNNPPNNYMEIHNCKALEADWGKFPFPNSTAVLNGPDSVLKQVLTTRTLKMTEYAATAYSTGCEAQCLCSDSNAASCTNTTDNTNTGCANSFAAAPGTAASDCASGCRYFPGTTLAACDSLGDSWDPQQRCCACTAGSTCTVGDNWNQDGDYTVNPATGFWPEFTTYLLDEFKAEYGADITLERVWCGWTCTELLLSGDAHMTGPYMNLDSFVNVYTVPHSSWTVGRSRVSQLESSCTTMGAPNTFFTKKPAPVPPVAAEEETNWGLIITLAVVALVLGTLLAVMVKKERDGSPLFANLQPVDEVGKEGANM